MHAKRGERASYKPIQSSLTKSTTPVNIVKAFLDIYSFDTVYIADLDAIQKKQPAYITNLQQIEEIRTHFPSLKLWLDAGISNHTEMQLWQKSGVHLVIGSENLASIAHYQVLAEQANQAFILSLDFLPQGYIGPTTLVENSMLWPNNVICMTLNAVGSAQGADTRLLEQIVTLNKSSKIYAAGGVRNIEDVQTLASMRLSGVLLASALHTKQITRDDISKFYAQQKARASTGF
ncbi:MAG: HisA/HisF-related TIM barrel protein [Methylophilaceae bacterium]